VFAGFLAVGLSSNSKVHFPDAFLNLGSVKVYDHTDAGQRYLTFAVSYSDDAVGFDAQTRKFQKGVVPEPDAQQFLVRLAQALSNCNENPKQLAHIQLIGFASTSGTKEVNIEAATQRGENVKKILDDNAITNHDGQRTVVELVPVDFEEMERQLRFFDRIDNKYNYILANLTRRTEVRLISAGSCETSNLGGGCGPVIEHP
jgi:hypothetical protein